MLSTWVEIVLSDVLSKYLFKTGRVGFYVLLLNVSIIYPAIFEQFVNVLVRNYKLFLLVFSETKL